MTPEQLLLDNLPLIEGVAAQTCRRCHLRKEDEEDFLGEVRLKMVADDYAVLRQFQGKSTLKCYLTTVVKNHMRDFQNHLWGKWRHSGAAKRLGPVAMELEKLLRDGYNFNETVAILQTNHQVKLSWKELNEIAAELPPRTPRHWEREEVLDDVPSADGQPDAGVVEQEKNALRVKVLAALQEALKTLPAEDQLILRMRLWSGFSVVQIAKVLKLDGKQQKALYKRIENAKEHLGREMERQGIREEDIDDLLDE